MSREIYKVKQCKMPRYSRVLYHQKGTRTYLSLKITKNRSTACVELTGGYCWPTPTYRNWCAQHTFFEGKKVEETAPRKSTPRTLKEVGQQYPGVFRAYAARANPCCTMRQQTSPLPLGKTLGQTGLTPGRIRVSAQCLMAHQRHHGGRCTDRCKHAIQVPQSTAYSLSRPSKATIF